LSRSDERSVYEEGCLSIPDYYAEVERPDTVTVSYLDGKGKQQEVRPTACWRPACSTRSTI
jgi:peptide deformylase